MISVIVYGRNDVHGYNAHRRTALSLNCVAQVLSEPDDEIVFVDYNSPDELPTLIEAISDTLTDRCLSRLRVLRVPAHVHHERFRPHTHLPIVEPVARNVGARRANPGNRWILSTTTDMVFLPREPTSLSAICSDIPDGYYALPRFELPEWLWERLPRNDPDRALSEIARLGPSLYLDETTLSHEPIRFDAPGDFQLVLRDDFFAIHGFDEEMLLGWHVDSNLSKRLLLHRGSIESLQEQLAGYHCNHNRIPTIYHSTVANDLHRFFVAVDQVDAHRQRDTWGLADLEIDEVPLRERTGSRFVEASLAATTRESQREVREFDARDTKFALDYDSRHVLPFVADSLIVSRRETTVGYLGTNPLLRAGLEDLLASLSLDRRLRTCAVEDPRSLETLDREADVFVVDLGTDHGTVGAPLATATGPEAARLRRDLVQVFDAFSRLVDLERRRLARGAHPRRFVLVNSTAVFWNGWILAHLQCGPTTPHARVRHAVVLPVADGSEAANEAQQRAFQLRRWIARETETSRRALVLRPDETVEVASLRDFSGFGEGWAFPDRRAVWSEGSCSQLSIAFADSTAEPCMLTLTFDDFALGSDGTLGIRLLANGALVGACNLPDHPPRRLDKRRLRDGRSPGSRRSGGRVHSLARSLGLSHIGILRQAFHGWLALSDRAGVLARRWRRRRSGAALVWQVYLPPSARTEAVHLALVQDAVAGGAGRGPGVHLTSVGLGRARSSRSLRRQDPARREVARA